MAFHNASIILPVMNETFSLEKTIEIIEQNCGEMVLEYIIVISKQTEKTTLVICNKFAQQDSKRFHVHLQTLPYLGGAIRETFDLAQGSHIVMMSSDLETDPYLVKDLIQKAKEHPEFIITATRWVKGGAFQNYSKIKLLCNFIFQKFFSLLYRTKLTDMTFGYRIFPTRLVQSIRWEELRHPFLFETIIKPLKLGVQTLEIPSQWRARLEGESQNSFFRNFVYFRIGLKTLFYSRKQILK